MKKITILLFCFAIFLSCKSVCAQSTTVHISDVNPVTDIDSAMSSSNKVRLSINFKVDNPEQADSVFVKFGTTASGAEIFTETGIFKKTGTDYFVKIQGPSYQIINGEASCKVKITKLQYTSATYLSLVVKDKEGAFTNQLSIRIN